MKILEYDDIDPLKVLWINQLALNFALTPELVAHIRRTDPRPFPCLAIYAVEQETLLGQVGIFRLPMISTEGREDVGGIWAVCTHPQYAGRGVASRLLIEAHERMCAAGLRFSTLGTDRYRVAHGLYQKHGYEDVGVLASAFAPWEVAHQPTRLHARRPGPGGYDFVEKVFESVAKDDLGFSWRYTPFFSLRDRVSLENIWILWKNEEPVGYALSHPDKSLLSLSNLLLKNGVDAAEAVAAVAGEIKTDFIKVSISRPVEISSLQRAGYQVAHPDWGAFVVKPLIPQVTIKDARSLFGIGTDRFLISWLDMT